MSRLPTKQSLRVCLIGATHLSRNPRLVREADSLLNNGHHVCVLTPCYDHRIINSDRALMASRGWRHQSIAVHRYGAGLFRSNYIRFKRRVASDLSQIFPHHYLAQRSLLIAYAELSCLAAAERADWYIAHALPALPVAVRAARANGARVGFDCEDLLALSGTDPVRIVKALQKEYLPACDYISVPSQAMADELSQEYKIVEPVVLPNVFPCTLAKEMKHPSERAKPNVLRLHWFSQTTGPGRGLEEAVSALSLLGGRAQLQIRGRLANGYEAQIRSLAKSYSVPNSVSFLPWINQDDVIQSMGDFDVGLALERPENRNSALTISNKMFSYLLGGLAIAATDTPGQRSVLRQAPGIGFLYPAGNSTQLAAGLRSWTDSPSLLQQAKVTAWDVARKRFCWDRFEGHFLELLSINGHESRSL